MLWRILTVSTIEAEREHLNNAEAQIPNDRGRCQPFLFRQGQRRLLDPFWGPGKVTFSDHFDPFCDLWRLVSGILEAAGVHIFKDASTNKAGGARVLFHVGTCSNKQTARLGPLWFIYDYLILFMTQCPLRKCKYSLKGRLCLLLAQGGVNSSSLEVLAALALKEEERKRCSTFTLTIVY